MARTKAPQTPGETPEHDDDALDTTPATAEAGEDELTAAQKAADAKGRAVLTSMGWVTPTPKLAQPVR